MSWIKKVIEVLVLIWNGLADLFYLMFTVKMIYIAYSFYNDGLLLEVAPIMLMLFYITFIPFLVRTAKQLAE